MTYDLAIIGSGPSGLTAGIYAGRAGIKAVIITGKAFGGQAAHIDNLENFSGIVATDGFTLTRDMRAQAENVGIEFIVGEVVKTELLGKIKKITLSNGENISSKAVIVATGASNRKLGLLNEDALIGQGISYCASCDGNFFKRKPVAVVGGGDTAFTDALYLKNVTDTVYLIHRSKEFRAAKILVDRAKKAGIKFVTDSVITSLKGNPLSAVIVKNLLSSETEEIEVRGLFVAIGTVPNSSLFKGELNLDDGGRIVTNALMETSVDGVFAAGDIRNTPFRQVITACSDGAIAADSAIKLLMK